MARTSRTDPVTPMPAANRCCPICGKPASVRHQPFCSPRCADVDLGRWFKENYSVPTEEAPDDNAEGDER